MAGTRVGVLAVCSALRSDILLGCSRRVCWCTVSDLLLTKLLPEMEAQRAAARAAEGAPTVPANDTAKSPSESMDALKTRISSYNALLDDALKEVALERTEDEEPTDRTVGATDGSLPTERAKQSMPVAKKQRV